MEQSVPESLHEPQSKVRLPTYTKPFAMTRLTCKEIDQDENRIHWGVRVSRHTNTDG